MNKSIPREAINQVMQAKLTHLAGWRMIQDTMQLTTKLLDADYMLFPRVRSVVI